MGFIAQKDQKQPIPSVAFASVFKDIRKDLTHKTEDFSRKI